MNKGRGFPPEVLKNQVKVLVKIINGSNCRQLCLRLTLLWQLKYDHIEARSI